MKHCNKCGKDKPISEFGKCRRDGSMYKDGRTYECRACHNRMRREFNKRHPKKNLEITRRYHTAHPEFRLLCGARCRAKQLGLPCTITIADISIPEFCPILGLKLLFGKKHAQDCSPSLDRIIPERGYVAGNIAVISHKANTMKSNASLGDLKKLVSWLEKNSLAHC